jgi:hypothetical protein
MSHLILQKGDWPMRARGPFDRPMPALLSLVVMLSVFDAPAAQAVGNKAPASRQLIIKFKPGTIACTPAGIAQLSSTTRVPLEFVRTMSGDACVVKQFSDNADILSHGQKTLEENPAVEYLEPDAVVEAF